MTNLPNLSHRKVSPLYHMRPRRCSGEIRWFCAKDSPHRLHIRKSPPSDLHSEFFRCSHAAITLLFTESGLSIETFSFYSIVTSELHKMFRSPGLCCSSSDGLTRSQHTRGNAYLAIYICLFEFSMIHWGWITKFFDLRCEPNVSFMTSKLRSHRIGGMATHVW